MTKQRPLAIAVAMLVAQVVSAAPLDLYVAPGGRDAADGRTVATAFATLARARDAVRAERAAGRLASGAVVHVAPGTYPQAETLTFTAADAGTAEAPVVYRGDRAAPPVVCGGPVIGGWQPHQGQVRRVDLRAAGLGGLTFGQLFFAGRRMPLARVPNLDPADLHGGAWAHVADPLPALPRAGFRTAPKEVDPARWQRPTDGLVSIFPNFDWAFNRVRVKAVEPAQQAVTLAGNVGYEIQVGDRYFVEGLFEELDAPGEWYLDQATSTLYFWPPEDLAQGEVIVPRVKDLVRCEQTAHLRFEHLVIEGCDGAGVVLQDSQGVVVGGCTVRNTGTWGVSVTGGEACRVTGCDVTGTGAGGIQLTGGDRRTLTPARHEATNNYIHHTAAFIRTYNCAINLGGVGNRAAHNLIHDTPHAAVAMSGNDNVLELNVVHHTNLQSTDTGGIYSCPRDWTQRGNVIRWNIWHDIGGFGKRSSWQPVSDGQVWFEYPHFTWGIYLDDPTSGFHVFGNVLYRVPISGLHNHGGRDNVWENNIVVDCPGFQAGLLAPDWSEWPNIYQKLRDVTPPGSVFFERYPVLKTYRDDHPEEMSGLKILRNIFYYTTAGTAWLRGERGWGNEQLLYTYTLREEDVAKNEFAQNLVHVPPELKLFISCTLRPQPNARLTWEEWQALGQDRGSQLGDPLFVDPANHDYRLRPESPALKLGFQPIPFERIGLHDDPLRATWPVREAPGAAGRNEPVKRAFQLPGFEPLPARELVPRGGLPNTLAKLAAGQPVRLAYYGGGIHSADGWRRQVLEGLRQAWPAAQLTAIDGSITDAVRGSGFSTYRFAHDVLAKQPDLVLVDYTSDDYQTSAFAIQRAIEGVVRQGRRANPRLEFLFVHAFRAGFEAAYDAGVTPAAVTAYERLAEHYGIPSVNVGLPAAALFKSGVWKDGKLPTKPVNDFYAASLLGGLTKLAGVGTPGERPLPPPLRPDHHEGATLLPVTREMLQGNWQELPADDPDRRAQARHFDTIWFTNTPGAKLTFTFRGTAASLFNLIGPDTGRVRVTVDGKDAGLRQQVDPWCTYQRLAALTLADALPLGDHTVTIELLPEPPDRSAPLAEARKQPNYDLTRFEGVALRIGWIRVLGEAPR